VECCGRRIRVFAFTEQRPHSLPIVRGTSSPRAAPTAAHPRATSLHRDGQAPSAAGELAAADTYDMAEVPEATSARRDPRVVGNTDMRERSSKICSTPPTGALAPSHRQRSNGSVAHSAKHHDSPGPRMWLRDDLSHRFEREPVPARQPAALHSRKPASVAPFGPDLVPAPNSSDATRDGLCPEPTMAE